MIILHFQKPEEMSECRAQPWKNYTK